MNLEEPGLTWDEPAYIEAGKTYIDGTLKLRFLDISIWEPNWEHPPVAKYLMGISLHFFKPLGFSEVIAARIPNTILGSLTCLLLYLFLRNTYGDSIAIMASLSLSFLPRFFAHTRYAALDAPETFFTVFSAYIFQKWVKTRKLRWAISSAFLLGITFSVKISALSLPFMLLAWTAIMNLQHCKKKEGKTMLKFFLFSLLFLLIAFATFILSWPLIWINPRHIMKYFTFHIHHFNIPVYYLGKVHQRAPWHYPFVMLFVTTPLSVLLAAVFGGIYAFKNLLKKCKKDDDSDDISILLLLWLMLTLLRVSVSYGYDGVRLFLDALPALTSLSSLGTARFSIFLHKIFKFTLKNSKTIFFFLSSLIIISEVYACFITHPYETSYYNELTIVSGGIKLFEKTYWGEVYKEVVEWLEIQAPGAEVVVPIAAHLARYYAKTLKIRDSISEISEKNSVYFAFQSREGFYFDPLIDFCLKNLRPVHTIQVNGIIIAYIYNVRDYYSQIENGTANFCDETFIFMKILNSY
jgi:4-amino-4-deoxy-L-arabinose transferase-like glycosyltransferase